MATERFALNERSQVVEIASNDGYLLRNFVAKGITVLGIDPAANVAKVAVERGVPTLVKFFGEDTAQQLVRQGLQADLILGNNVLAHVPKLNDFVRGMTILLKPQGSITMEFPHLLQLMVKNEFDTIYHEHFSYLSFTTVEALFAAHGLTLFDVEELPTHGGSLRIYARHSEDSSRAISQHVRDLKSREEKAGLTRLETYLSFTKQVEETKRKLLEFLIRAKRRGKSVVAYGAAAKGVTLLNYCGVRSDFIDYAVDLSSYKQGLYMPGVHIPIFHPDKISETKPDYVLILPWTIKHEIMRQMKHIGDWDGQFVVPIPEVEILSPGPAARIGSRLT
jgi:SAM-dependent methyltransferase